MSAGGSYVVDAPDRAAVDSFQGPLVLEFGTAWCGYCSAARPRIETALAARPDVRHLKVEDGPGRPLGRSFRVKLWPTLIFLIDGQEVARLVRPTDAEAIADAVAALDRP